MNPLVRDLFHELADLSRQEQERVLTERRIPPEIRTEVESLLASDSSDGRSLTEGVSRAAQAVLSQEAQTRSWGAYRYLGVLGSGGMGAVYLAERVDGELQHKVAVKVLRTDAERPGWRARFLKERQFLTYLNHPSVVHLIDAGHTENREPYLVMEYVDGTPIDAYCEKLDLHDQLRLFLLLCDGVAHAHRHLIIHRDLKPSNILVDRSGQPKILDFGIAKLLDETGANRTITIDRLLTLNYASPEQLRGGEETTATDVYSLGAILYKIIVGRSPHESEGGMSVAMDVISGSRPFTPLRTVKPDLPGDVDFILRKALRIEVGERYGSVEALANDVRAFLEWRPVQARSGDAWYRARKFLRRYWVPVGAAALLIVGLSLALFAVNRQRALAERRFQQVRELSNKVLALDQLMRNLPGTTKARIELVQMSKDYLEGLSAEATADPTLALEVGSAFVSLAEAQGVPTTVNLGQYAQADQSLIKADALIDSVLAKSPGNRKALLVSADLNHDRMILADSDRRRDDVLVDARKASERLESFIRGGNGSLEEPVLVIRILNNIALAHKNLHLYADSIRYARRAVDLTKGMALVNRSSGFSVMADAMRLSGDLDGALHNIQEAETILRDAKVNVPPPDIASVLWRKGLILGDTDSISLNRTDEAVAVLENEMDLLESHAQKDPDDAGIRILFISWGRVLGAILRETDPGRALEVYDLALRRIREVANNTRARRGEAQLLGASSYVLRQLKRPREAEQRIGAALQLLRDTKNYPAKSIVPGDEVGTVLEAQAAHFAAVGQTGRAADLYQEVLDKILASHPDPANDLVHAGTLSRLYEALSKIHALLGHSAEAQRFAESRLELWRNWNRKLGDNPFIQRQLRAATSE